MVVHSARKTPIASAARYQRGAPDQSINNGKMPTHSCQRKGKAMLTIIAVLLGLQAYILLMIMLNLRNLNEWQALNNQILHKINSALRAQQ